MSDVFDKDWSVAVNLGIKCNGAPMLRDLGYRYISSPFDNMDSVDGLVQAGRLIASRFEGYWDAKKWILSNDRIPRDVAIRTKIARHEDYPGLFFPHFHAGWMNDCSEESLAEWLHDAEGTLEFVWEGLERTFDGRQQRLVQLLGSGQPLLFVLIDERRQMSRLQNRTAANDVRRFMDMLALAYPNADIGFLYYFCPREGERTPESTQNITFVPIPADARETTFVKESMGTRLSLRPRADLQMDDTLVV